MRKAPRVRHTVRHTRGTSINVVPYFSSYRAIVHSIALIASCVTPITPNLPHRVTCLMPIPGRPCTAPYHTHRVMCLVEPRVKHIGADCAGWHAAGARPLWPLATLSKRSFNFQGIKGVA